MTKYLCLQRNIPGGGPSMEKPSPAQMQAMYAKFNEWREKFQKNLVDLGGRLGAGRVATATPAPDGPLVEVKELVGGYAVIEVRSYDEALELGRRLMQIHKDNWPGFEGSVEIRQIAEF